ncbi:hypothetical protein BH10BDE1_BH10BDE1_25380 [soil metagenome]
MGLFENRGWRFVSFNTENFFVYLDEAPAKDPRLMTEIEWSRLSRSTADNKQLSKIRDIARSIEDLDPDVLMLSEVGGRESLANFSRYFLGDRYATHLIEGNSDRGIDLGFLVKRSLPLTYDLISHKSRKLDFLYPHEKMSKETGYTHLRSGRVTGHRFSRDVVELRCYADPPAENGEIAKPEFILMLVHLKSPLDKDRIDPGGRDRRKAELEMLVTIYREVSTELPDVPIFISGDFNGTIFGPFGEAEFEAMRASDLKCCLELADIPQDERFTWMYLNNRRPGMSRQLDYILVPERLRSRVDLEQTWVYRFRDENGKYRMIPRNQNEKRTLPSDHYPVVLTLKPESESESESSGTSTSNQSSAGVKPRLE